MSNILYKELVWTYKWLRTFIPWRVERKGPVMTKILRRAHRVQMRKNQVLSSFWARVRGR